MGGCPQGVKKVTPTVSSANTYSPQSNLFKSQTIAIASSQLSGLSQIKLDP